MAIRGNYERYCVLEPPKFDSIIPAHLTEKLDKKDRYLVETVSKIEQQNAWLVKKMCDASRVYADLDRRVSSVERWRDRITSKWGVAAALALTIVVPVFVNIITRKFVP